VRRAALGGYLAWGCLAVGGLAGGGPLGAGFVAECGDGGFDGRVEVVRVDRAGEPVTFDLAPYRTLELGETRLMPWAFSASSRSSSTSEAVVPTSVIGSAAITIQTGGGSARASRLTSSRNVVALAKNSGASNR